MKPLLYVLGTAFSGVMIASCASVPLVDTYASEGERLYAENCSRCHRQPEQFSNQGNETLKRTISKGAHRMPAFPDITAEEQQEIIAYIRNL